MPDEPQKPATGRSSGLTAPKRWPVRWRLAGVSALLTFLILVVFAFVVGRLVSSRLHHDFDSEVSDAANRLAFQVQVQPLSEINPNPGQMALPPTVAVRVVTPNGQVLAHSTGAPRLPGPPHPGLSTVGPLRVATVTTRDINFQRVDVQYLRSEQSINETIDRLWLFLGGGVLGGTLLAALAGVMIAARAMRPVSSLTAVAREIAATRDPSRRVPQPEADDEVAELARTLDQMLGQLDAARSEREHMLQAQREFVADASHELRTPLTSILANLELLQDRVTGVKADGEDGEIVDSALRSSRRMSRLVSDLLMLARADAGRTGARHECDLTEIAASALAEVRPVADGHLLDLATEGPVPVNGNPDELHRLALNLLDNGLRHTPPGTSIEIAVERRNGEAILEVSDDGPGLPQGMEQQVFARFVRGLGPADTRSDSGTGLGLAIVQAVAVSHGGAVEAGASPSGGARFVVRLPAAPA